jgi:hypothetical protein
MRLTTTTNDGSVAMSNTYQEWEDEEEDFEVEDSRQRQNSDSDLLKQLRKELKTKTKLLSEMETQLGSIKSEQRQNVITSFLESKGVSPKIAKFIPQDIDASPDAIENWIVDNADVFGLTVQTPADVQPDLATLRQIDAVTANAQSPAGLDDIMLRLQNAESEDEIKALIFQSGGEE